MTRGGVWRFHRDKWGSDTAELRCQNWGKATPGSNPDSHVLGTVAHQVRLGAFFKKSFGAAVAVLRCVLCLLSRRRGDKKQHTHKLHSRNVLSLWFHLITSCGCWRFDSSTFLIKQAVNTNLADTQTHLSSAHSMKYKWIKRLRKQYTETQMQTGIHSL